MTQMALTSLPAAVFATLFAALAGIDRRRVDGRVDWREGFLQAACVRGGLVTLFSEGLSLFNAMSQPAAGHLWGMPAASRTRRDDCSLSRMVDPLAPLQSRAGSRRPWFATRGGNRSAPVRTQEHRPGST